MDTVGPSRVHSAAEKCYVLVIVNDFSCYSWVFFLASKDEVFMHFQSLALRLFKEQEGALHTIRSDNGTEFKNASIDAFCRDHGIEHQFSAPQVPQQNVIVKRKNRMLVEMAWTMLDEHRTLR